MRPAAKGQNLTTGFQLEMFPRDWFGHRFKTEKGGNILLGMAYLFDLKQLLKRMPQTI